MSLTSSTVLVSICYLAMTLFQPTESSNSTKYPSWVKGCSKKGPLSLDDCIIKRIMTAKPHVIHGYPRFRIPVLEPLHINSIDIGSRGKQVGLALNLSSTEIYGLKDARFFNSKIDLANRHWEVDFVNPRLEVLGNYMMDGKVLILPIRGEGPGNITMTDITGQFKMDWELYKKHNKDYTHITKSKTTFKTGRAYFKLRNLFNGDKNLGAQMNIFLNENWPEVVREFGPAVADAFNEVFQRIIQNGLDLAPFDSFILD